MSLVPSKGQRATGYMAGALESLDYEMSMRQMALSHGAPDTRGYSWRVLRLAKPAAIAENEVLARV